MKPFVLLIVITMSLVAGAMLHSAVRITFGPTIIDKMVEVAIKETDSIKMDAQKTKDMQTIIK
ncbi:MAG: hypothetical protein HQL78_04845 [Magnetococcales bacterium]|nr:hypothetical protein [Magnetococcales bacterium]